MQIPVFPPEMKQTVPTQTTILYLFSINRPYTDQAVGGIVHFFLLVILARGPLFLLESPLSTPLAFKTASGQPQQQHVHTTHA